MKSIRSLAGELLIDHRNSPGIAPEILVANNLPASAGKGIFETAVYSCGHCQAMVPEDPKMYLCRGCTHILCDRCAKQKALTGLCRPFAQWADEVLTAAEAASRS
jgi:hypothetical protein